MWGMIVSDSNVCIGQTPLEPKGPEGLCHFSMSVATDYGIDTRNHVDRRSAWACTEPRV